MIERYIRTVSGKKLQVYEEYRYLILPSEEQCRLMNKTIPKYVPNTVYDKFCYWVYEHGWCVLIGAVLFVLGMAWLAYG